MIYGDNASIEIGMMEHPFKLKEIVEYSINQEKGLGKVVVVYSDTLVLKRLTWFGRLLYKIGWLK